MIADVEKIIREYLPSVIHLSLATSHNNKPWICEVHYVFDDQLNFYFRSKPSRKHSQDIAKNTYVAGNIIKQHNVGEDVRGIYFEGKAKLLAEVDENHPAYQLYCERFGTNQAILKEALTEDGHKFYQITVTTFYVFDSVESKPSRKYELGWKQ